ncbi:protein associated with UVRAG as autophagy enhancer-like isoform X3 [Acipenser oxyrinchus oxyrinchus]|uniref:Protein associated with UVRAG as autophagy enhancer-like isoform X3 n=1 Tax=Acipenser oxyrinchus oxyrinchus TaxID=40147 RepID=A0AAD8DEU5_ACIOX|nr:protein associated with UVRAG as autophagy enhancer-like isoform X3 [Acipenser oxyrinchus oxyrinchus]
MSSSRITRKRYGTVKRHSRKNDMDQRISQMIDKGNAPLPLPVSECEPSRGSKGVLQKTSSVNQTPLTSLLSGEFSKPAVIGHSDSPAAIKEILVSVLETSGGLKYQPVLKNAAGARDWSDSSDEELTGGSSTDGCDGYYRNSNTTCQTDNETTGQLDSVHLDAGFDRLSLPRSSPVISRKMISPPVERSPSHVLLSSSPETSATSETRPAESQDERRSPSLPPPKPRSNSLTASFNRLFPTGLYFPFRGSAFMEGVWGNSEEGSNSDISIYSVRSEQNAEELVSPVDYTVRPLSASTEIDKENAHFIIADMIVAALENMKCTILSRTANQSGTASAASGVSEEASDGCHSVSKKHSKSTASSDSGYEGYPGHQSITRLSPDLTASNPHLEKEEEVSECKLDENKPSTEDTETASSSSPSSRPCCAEALAQQLVRMFRKQWLHSECQQQQQSGSLHPSLQELLPGGADWMAESSLNLAEEIKLKSRMRGTWIWAPPRFQIIFIIHPVSKRDSVVASQHYLCAGCGTQVEPRYIKKLRYCEYLGKYFCDCCHSNSESLIPGRVIMKWDFSKYPVCNFSKQLLDCIWQNPLFNVSCINTSLYTKVKELDKFRELQEQLIIIKKLLKSCRESVSLLQEFEQLPEHLTQEQHLFSMDDFMKIKRGVLVPQAKGLLKTALSHVENCELCQAKGFICEICRNNDVLFPFQTDICKRCAVCKACFHKDCFRFEQCPKCTRIQTRQNRISQLVV